MVSNPNFYGQSTHGTPNQIEDGVDFPHTGIVKALSDGLGQNYAISGFDITIDSATQIDVGAGVIFRDGKKVPVSAVPNLTLSSTYTNGYHLLIASNASSSVLTIRNPTAADKVPEYTAGDTIIAVITHNGTANVGIQYLTVNKTENSLSIGRDNSGYTEGLTIQSNAGDIEIEALEQDKDIIFKVNDGGSTTDRLILYGDNDPSYPNTEVKIEGSLLTTEDIQANKLVIGYGNTPASGVAEIGSYSNSEDMVFKTGSSVERIRITDAGRVGVGINNPTGLFHVKGTSASDIDFMVEVAEDGASASPDIVYFRNSASPAAGDDLAHIRFRGRDSAGNTTDYVDMFAEIVDTTDGSEDGRITFRTLKNGAIISRIELDSDETVINDGGADLNFRVEGDTEANLLFTDAGNDRVGIATNTPTTKLEVKGDTTISRSADTGQTRTLIIEGARNATGTNYAQIDFKNYDSNGPTSYTGARISAVNDADGVDDGTLTFSTNNANAGITERMRIDDEGNVGIGTTSPTEKLHLSDADGTEPTILIENTGTDANEPELVFLRNTSGADGRDIGNIKFKAKDSAGNLHTFAQIMADSLDADTGTEDGRLVFSLTQAGTDHVEFFTMGNLESVFNNGGNDIDFRVEGNTEANLIFADAGNDKVGIGTNTLGDGVLSLSGAINTKGRIQNITEVIGSALGPPPVVNYSILKTDDIIIAKAPSGSPPNNLTLHLPDAEAADIGRTYRIIASDATATLSLDRTGTDDAIEDTTGGTLTLPYSLSAGKIYDVVCIDADRWMLMQLN